MLEHSLVDEVLDIGKAQVVRCAFGEIKDATVFSDKIAAVDIRAYFDKKMFRGPLICSQVESEFSHVVAQNFVVIREERCFELAHVIPQFCGERESGLHSQLAESFETLLQVKVCTLFISQDCLVPHDQCRLDAVRQVVQIFFCRVFSLHQFHDVFVHRLTLCCYRSHCLLVVRPHRYRRVTLCALHALQELDGCCHLKIRTVGPRIRWGHSSALRMKQHEALRARERIDELLSVATNATSTDEKDDFPLCGITSLEALKEFFVERGEHLCEQCEQPVESRSQVDTETEVELVVESVGGQAFPDVSTAIQSTDHSIAPDIAEEYAAALKRAAASMDPTHPVSMWLRNRFGIELNSRTSPLSVIVRIGIARWAPSYFGLGAELCAARELNFCEGFALCCSVHSTYPLIHDQTSMEWQNADETSEEGDVFYDCSTKTEIVQPMFWLRMWSNNSSHATPSDSSDATSPQQQHSPVKGHEEEGLIGDDDNLTLENKRRPVSTTLYAWGDNPKNCLCINDSNVSSTPSSFAFAPAQVLTRNIPFEQRVRMVSCSARHTLVLTSHRRLFACGDNEDGACGVDGRSYVPTLAAIAWPDEINVETKFVAAGADVFGAHSAAVSVGGTLYTWGFGVATGQHTIKPILRPRPLASSDEQFQLPQFSTVSAGGSFCVALDVNGNAFSWGVWANGRLGLGSIPSVRQSRSTYGDRQKLATYQFYPKPITSVGGHQDTPGVSRGNRGVEDAFRTNLHSAPKWRSVACGEAHALAVTLDGRLYAWGQNAYGQLGLGPASDGALRDEKIPLPVLPFSTSRSDAQLVDCHSVFVADVACGPTHSIAIDSEGGTWMWGGGSNGGHLIGCGESCLTPGSLQSTTDLIARRVLDLKRCSSQSLQTGTPRIEFRIEKNWALPRRIDCGHRIKAAACGESHTVLHTRDDQLLACGNGFAVIGRGVEEIEEGLHDAVTQSARSERSEKNLVEIASAASASATIRFPRAANSRWLQAIHGQRVRHVACGGQHTVALLSGAKAADALGRQLLDCATKAAAYVADADDDIYPLERPSSVVSLFGVDCLLIPGGGSPLYAHMAVLARRSSLFAELILLESREDSLGNEDVLQLLVPDLNPTIARAVLEYIYCDDIFESRSGNNLHPAFLNELSAAAIRYGLPRLAAISTMLSQATESFPDESIPSSTLEREFLSLIGDSSFSDVKIIAEDQTLHAHRFVLVARSDYFRAMFSSGMREGVRSSVEIDVPDTYAGMLRLLKYVYGDILEDGDTQQVLEDFVAADRYGLLQMKLACESSLATNVSSVQEALAILQVSHSVGATSSFKSEMISFILRNISDPFVSANLSTISKFEPDLSKKVCDALALTHESAMYPPATKSETLDQEESDKKIHANLLSLKQAASIFVVSLITAVLQRAFRFQGSGILAINVLFMAAVFLILWHTSGNKTQGATD